MFGAIKSGLAALAGFIKAINWLQRKAERDENKEAGRREQQNVDLKDDREKASKARRTREDVDRMSDADVADGLRKYARKPRK